MSSSNTAAFSLHSKCATSFASALRFILTSEIQEIREEDILATCWHLFLLYRTSVFRPLCAGANHTIVAPLHLSVKSVSDVWEKSIDRKVIALYGDAAGTVAPKKVCGALLTALETESEVYLKKKKATEFTSLAEVIEVFASKRLLEWHTNYLSTIDIPASNVITHAAKIKMLSELFSLFFTEWSAIYRKAPDRKFATDDTDFREITLGVNANVFGHIYSFLLHYHRKKVSEGDVSAKSHAIQAAEQLIKHKAVAQRFEPWLQQQNAKNGGAPGKGGGAPGLVKDDGWTPRVCKALDYCCEVDPLIDHGMKYVLVRCTEGCALSFHSACYTASEPDITSEVALPCMNKRGCAGNITRIVIKLGTQVVTDLYGVAHEAEAEESEDMPEQDGDAANGSDDPRYRRNIVNPSTGVLGPSVLDVKPTVLVAGPVRGMKTNLIKFGVRGREDSVLAYKDQQHKAERAELRAEKRQREEERAAEKKKREEELAAAVAAKQAAAPEKEPAPIKATPSTTKKSTGMFEVVVPLVRQPGESSPAIAPTKSNLAPFSSSSSSKHVNAFSALNLDEDEEPRNGSANGATPANAWSSAKKPASHLVRNAWQDDPSEHLASNKDDEPTVENLFPITVKSRKNKSKRAETVHVDEDADLSRALAASMAEMGPPLPKPHAKPIPSAAATLFGSKAAPTPATSSKTDFPGLPSAKQAPAPLADSKPAPTAPWAATAAAAVAASSAAVTAAASASAAVSNSVTPTPSSTASPALAPSASPATAPSQSVPMTSTTPPGGAITPTKFRSEGQAPEDEPGSEHDGGQSQGEADTDIDDRASLASESLSSMSNVSSRSVSPASSLLQRQNSSPALQPQMPMFTQRAVALPIGSVKAVAMPIGTSVAAPAVTIAKSSPAPIAPVRSASSPLHVTSHISPIGFAPSSTITPPIGTPIAASSPSISFSSSLFANPVTAPMLPMAPIVAPIANGHVTTAMPIGSAAPPPAPSQFTKIDVVHSVPLSSEPTHVLVLRNLPSCVSIAHIGGLMAVFGKIMVRQVFATSHGLTGIVTFQSRVAAETACAQMQGRVYALETVADDGQSEYEQWQVECAFGRSPVLLRKPQPTAIRLVNKPQ